MPLASTAPPGRLSHTSRRIAPRSLRGLRPETSSFPWMTRRYPIRMRSNTASPPGGASGEASLEVLRGGTRRKLNVLLIVAPESPPRDARDLTGNHPLGGAKVANLSPAVADEVSDHRDEGRRGRGDRVFFHACRIGIQPVISSPRSTARKSRTRAGSKRSCPIAHGCAHEHPAQGRADTDDYRAVI